MATNDAEYQRDHKRVRESRGKAHEHVCICGKQALDWSHNHGTNPSDPDNYRALCRLCHREYDRPDWLKAERARERERIEAGRTSKGWTPERREKQRQRMLEKWSNPVEREQQAERAKRDQPWKGRRPANGGVAR